ncbi:hypothetical protein BD311DRAFT_812661 [Dichomitus squalens]|uniref:Uncharacterized protein n=1 Tax=Dichomitus squalens TaxID=114155 RepID=A0A4Q9M699_9APHY|nr:hypothetical protein BD311DRAFT_812661 [Dichomitus squalens]
MSPVACYTAPHGWEMDAQERLGRYAHPVLAVPAQQRPWTRPERASSEPLPVPENELH